MPLSEINNAYEDGFLSVEEEAKAIRIHIFAIIQLPNRVCGNFDCRDFCLDTQKMDFWINKII